MFGKSFIPFLCSLAASLLVEATHAYFDVSHSWTSFHLTVTDSSFRKHLAHLPFITLLSSVFFPLHGVYVSKTTLLIFPLPQKTVHLGSQQLHGCICSDSRLESHFTLPISIV